MSKKYFTDNEHDKLIYFQMPKVLVYGEKYEKLSNDAKMLYMVCFDLIKISMENHGKYNKYGKRQNWKDEKGFYIKLSIESIKKVMKCGRNKAINLKSDLEKCDLLEQKRVGLNQANLLYVLQLDFSESDIYTVNELHEELMEEPKEEKKESKPLGGQRKFKNQTSGSLKNKPQEVYKSNPIKNEFIKNELSNEEEEINNAYANNATYEMLNYSLHTKGIDQQTINQIIKELLNRGLDMFLMEDVEKQYKLMMDKLTYGEVDNHNGFAVYFANGLQMRSVQSNASKKYLQEKLREYEIAMQQKQKKDTSIYYNWLEE